MSEPAEVIRGVLGELGIDWQEPTPGEFVATLPGTRKLQTTCVLTVGDHALGVHAFVARHPDENHEAVYRYLLENNLKQYAVAFGIDHVGDIHLSGRLPLHAVTPEEVDRLLGVVLDTADTAFNQIVALGFESSIRREWRWRLDRGESTRNLEAFQHLAEPRPGVAGSGGAGVDGTGSGGAGPGGGDGG